MDDSRDTTYLSELSAAVEYLKPQLGQIDVGLVLGSGLGAFVEKISEATIIEYRDIPFFPVPTAVGHQGRLVFGKLAGVRLAVLQGRVHCYEGYSAARVAFAVRVLGLLGIKSLILTNAVGGINLKLEVGDLMFIRNHISIFCQDPSLGLESPILGPRFYDQTNPYQHELFPEIERQALAKEIPLKSGIYCMLPGPRYESAADVLALRALGADAVGMSIVPEALAARQIGLKNIVGLSLITNKAAGLNQQTLKHQEVLETAKLAQKSLFCLVSEVIVPLLA